MQPVRIPQETASLLGSSQDLLSYEQVATALNLPKGTLYSLVSQGKIPFIRLGPRTVRFEPAALDAWLFARRVVPR